MFVIDKNQGDSEEMYFLCAYMVLKLCALVASAFGGSASHGQTGGSDHVASYFAKASYQNSGENNITLNFHYKLVCFLLFFNLLL
ncbi:hypothetical protein [Ferruginibacter sp.]